MNVQEVVKQYDILFNDLLTPEGVFDYDVGYLADTLITLLPVHVGITINDFADVDGLLSIYPYIYQKVVILHAHMVHKVRIYSGRGNNEKLGKARDLRDTLEEILRVIKLQYESVSRRITLRIENR
jgi:hypothetical protein